jgi:hypothetical protein
MSSEEKVFVTVGDLDKLKKSIDVFVGSGKGAEMFEQLDAIEVLVSLAERVVAAEEKTRALLNTTVDVDSSCM